MADRDAARSDFSQAASGKQTTDTVLDAPFDHARELLGELADVVGASAANSALAPYLSETGAFVARHGPTLGLVACLALLVPMLLARQWLLATAGAICAVACLMWVGVSPAPVPILVAVNALLALHAIRARRSVGRQAGRQRDAVQRIAGLERQLTAERFWRIASGDERPALIDAEVLELARQVQSSSGDGEVIAADVSVARVEPKPPRQSTEAVAEVRL